LIDGDPEGTVVLTMSPEVCKRPHLIPNFPVRRLKISHQISMNQMMSAVWEMRVPVIFRPPQMSGLFFSLLFHSPFTSIGTKLADIIFMASKKHQKTMKKLKMQVKILSRLGKSMKTLPMGSRWTVSIHSKTVQVIWIGKIEMIWES
jgi:hypothetical protein